MKKWLATAAAIVLGLPLAALAGVVLFLRTAVLDQSGTFAVPGLAAPVEIIRDAHGVAHIFAPSADAAWFALGYAHAQDRLAQMEFMRRFGSGRIAELIGPAGVGTDRLIRSLGLAEAAEAAVAALPEASRQTLEAYARGVNAFMATFRGAWPPEFYALRTTPEPWQPRDSLLFGQIMAVQLSGNWRDEFLRARFADRLTPAQRAELWPEWPNDNAIALNQLQALYRTLDLDRLAASLPSLGPERASNEWVVAGARSATGRPILVNDPHLGLEAPGTWYLARIVAPGINLVGATAPGVPAVLLGHNGRIAWGFTTTNGDANDLFIERVDPADPTRYLTESGSEPFRTRRETIRVRGGDDVTITVRFTRNGLVLSDVLPDARAAAPAGHVLVVASTRFGRVDTTPAALFALQAARDWNEFQAALRDWQAPMQNVVYADVDGNIGFIVPGLLPLRGAGDGSVPLPGWIEANRWRGTVPFEALPRLYNPPSGRIANANNRVAPPDFPVQITADPDSPYRVQRILELLDARPTHGVADMERMLADPVSRFAREILALVRERRPASPRAAEALALLQVWDGAMRRELPQPLIFNAWMRALAADLLRGALGEGVGTLGREFPAMLRAAVAGRSAVCGADAVRCAAAVDSALERALGDLTARYGESMGRWRWGAAHVARFPNRLIERVPGLRELFGFRIATDGDFFTLNRGGARDDGEYPFAHVHGAGYRAIYDMADLDRSLFVATPGQSGHPLSAHWGDLAPGWANGRHFTIAGTRDELAARGAVLRLEPARREGMR